MSEERNIRAVRTIGIAIIVGHVLMNAVFYMNSYGISIEQLNTISMNGVNTFSYLPLIALFIFALFNGNKTVNNEFADKVNAEMTIMKIFNGIFIGYIVITVALIRNKDVILSSIIMELAYIGIMIATRNIKIVKCCEERKLQWEKSWEAPENMDKESKLWWRWKLWFAPHIKVPFKERWGRFSRLLWDICLVYVFITSRGTIFSVVIIILLIRDIFSWIEAIFGLYTSMTGICTGILSYSRDKGRGPYYKVYLTDYKNEREIVFQVEGENYAFSECDRITVVHGIFSKTVKYVEGIRLNIK